MSKVSVRMRTNRFMLIVSLLSLMSCNMVGGSNKTIYESIAVEPDTTMRITLLFAGDMMQHDGQIKAAHCTDNSYDYSECFKYMKSEIEEADVAIANLEVTLGGVPYKGYPRFSAPDQYATAIKDAGFDLLLTNNNHSCDTGSRGLGRTIRILDSLNIPHVGTYANESERMQNYPFLLEKNGFRIALLSYTYGTNGIQVPAPFVVNLIDTVQMKSDIADAKAMNPDVIIAFMHWGTEYVLHPSNTQRWQADWLLNRGVDHVIGGHPHVVQPMEMRTGADGQKHLVVWSLGNFISNMTKPNTYGGLMVRLSLEKDSTVRVSNCDYSLHWTSRPSVSHHKTHRVYPVNISHSLLNANERKMLNMFTTTSRRLFKQYNVGVCERQK